MGYHSARYNLEHKKTLTREDRDSVIKVLIRYNHLLSKRTRQLGKAKSDLRYEKKHKFDLIDVVLIGAMLFAVGYKLGGV